MIPKIIHYCWLSGDPLPKKIQKYLDSWKKYLPDYEFMLWDKSRFDIHSVKWVEQAYEAKKYAFASDYIRLYAVYNYGGIYMDMDMEIVKPFDLLQFTNGVNWGLDESGDIEAAFLAGSGKNSVLRDLMNMYENMSFIDGNGNMNLTVANIYIQNYLNNYGYMKNPQMQILDGCDVKLFPADYFNCRSLVSGRLILSENSCCIHWHSVMWASPYIRFVGWLRIKIIVPLIGVRNYGRIQKFLGRV